MCECESVSQFDNEVIAKGDVDGVTVSTIYMPSRGYYETCLFDDRVAVEDLQGSHVVDSYSTREGAMAGYRAYLAMTQRTLLKLIEAYS